jgi:hypothetical protein
MDPEAFGLDAVDENLEVSYDGRANDILTTASAEGRSGYHR